MATHQQEILMFVSRHLGFLTYHGSHTIKNSSNEFFVLENMGIAVGILQLRCIQAEIKYFRFIGRHFEFLMFACIAQ